MSVRLAGSGAADGWGRQLQSLHLHVWGMGERGGLGCLPASPVLAPDLTAVVAIATAAADLGLSRVRLTGADLLLRPDLVDLVAALAGLNGIRQVALTTDGSRLAERATALRAAGLHGVNVRLDSRNPQTFQRATGHPGLPQVWEGLAEAERVGLGPLKINTVVRRGLNDCELDALADLTRSNPWQVRFIECLPGSSPDWQAWHVPLHEIRQALWGLGELEPVTSPGIAELYRLPLALGTLGLIGWQGAPGCARCSRLHVSLEGYACGCMLAGEAVDLRPAGRDPERLRALLGMAIGAKPAGCPPLPAAVHGWAGRARR